MNRLLPLLKFLAWLFLAFVLYAFLSLESAPFSANDLLVERFVTGFWHFLVKNVPAMSWNAATWGPGLGSFVVALIFAHRWLTRWAARTGRPWNLATSFCLVSLVPVLFVISFIVPGVLLQWEILRETVWIEVS